MTIDAGADAFEEHRGLVFAVAYRMLGSVAEAEDVVQDTYVRWSTKVSDEVDNPEALFTTIATRLSIDRMRSAQRRRETYVGPWLPEPLETADDPFATVELADSLTLAFLTLLDLLSPTERAVLLLHDVFEYEYAAIAGMVDRSAANCRQLASRARRRLAAERPLVARPAGDTRPVVERFLAALATGDVGTVLDVLGDDVVLVSDGGPSKHAARRPVVGPHRVSRFLLNIGKRVPADATMRMVSMNGEPTVLVSSHGEPWATVTISVSDGVIRSFFVQLSPDKLRHLARSALD
jgi:RNA polymerase sigma-70 factor (TIGR02957 family)